MGREEVDGDLGKDGEVTGAVDVEGRPVRNSSITAGVAGIKRKTRTTGAAEPKDRFCNFRLPIGDTLTNEVG